MSNALRDAKVYSIYHKVVVFKKPDGRFFAKTIFKNEWEKRYFEKDFLNYENCKRAIRRFNKRRYAHNNEPYVKGY